MTNDRPPEGTDNPRDQATDSGETSAAGLDNSRESQLLDPAAPSDDLLRSTLESAQIGVWEADLETRQAWWSPVQAAIFGYGAEEGHPCSVDTFLEHVHPEDRSWVDRLIREGTRQGTGSAFECRILRRDRTLRWVAIRSAPVPGGLVPGRRLRGIVMDVTDRRLAEMAAQESHRRFALLANSAPVLIWTSDVDKLCDFFNEPWLAFTGRSLQQELGNGWAEGVHPEDFDRCLKTYVSHFDARLPFRIEYRLRRHDGVYRWILDHGVPRYLPDGSFTGYIGSCIDVTEQRLDREAAHEAIRAAQRLQSVLEELTAQQRAILDTSPLGIALIRDRQVTWTNPAHQALFGYDEEESRGMPTRAFYERESDYERLGIEVYPALRRGETYTAEVRLKRKGGGVFWCQMVGKALNPANPENGSIWLLKDVDGVRRAEARFRLQSEMLAHMGEGVVLVRASDGTIVHTNPMYDRMLGYAHGELHGQPISIVNVPGELSPEEVAARIFDHLHQFGRWEGDIANLRKDGTTIVCHASVSRLEHSELGDLWMSIHTDVTRARQLEQALLQSKKQYDNLVSRIPTGVQLVRLRPDATYRFDFVSPRTAQLVGVDLEELYQDATLWTRHAWPEDAAKAAEETRRCIATGKPYNWEGRFDVGGTTRWLRFEGWPAPQADGDVYWHAVVNDITEQKALERSRREAQKLAAVGRIAGGMAHEFNNILAAMLINIGMAQDDDDPASVRELLGDLEQSCARARALVQQLLAFSQQSVLSPRQLELNEFLSRQVPRLQSSLGDGIRVEGTGSKDPLLVMADPALLGQALRELSENAADAMEGNGVVRIDLEAIEVAVERTPTPSEARSGRFARLSISDHGCGLDLTTRGRLFEPFFSTKAAKHGTGLGLATVRGIVHQHRGWVEVESELGRGSCFRVYLPLATDTEHSSVAPPAAPSPADAAATILLAESDPGLRKVVSVLLNRAGYRVVTASDASAVQAVWEAQGSGIDLLLSDAVLSGAESGLQVAQRLLEQRPGLKVILTSGYNATRPERPPEARERIVCLPKPVPAELLLQTVRHCLKTSP